MKVTKRKPLHGALGHKTRNKPDLQTDAVRRLSWHRSSTDAYDFLDQGVHFDDAGAVLSLKGAFCPIKWL